MRMVILRSSGIPYTKLWTSLLRYSRTMWALSRVGPENLTYDATRSIKGFASRGIFLIFHLRRMLFNATSNSENSRMM